MYVLCRFVYDLCRFMYEKSRKSMVYYYRRKLKTNGPCH
nr:MAG TPA: hypothetical protein [Caudoviricetes sp.]